MVENRIVVVMRCSDSVGKGEKVVRSGVHEKRVSKKVGAERSKCLELERSGQRLT